MGRSRAFETIFTIDRAEFMEAASRSALEPLKDELEPLPDSDGPAPVKASNASPADIALSSTQELVSMESLMGWSDLASRAIVETHKELSVVQGQIGLGAVRMGGDPGDKPPEAAVVDRVRMRNLRVAS